MTRPALRSGCWVAVAGVISVVAAACGGGVLSTGVARTGARTSTSDVPAGPAATSLAGLQSAALAFARCMRSHGEPGYPDPSAQGGSSVARAQAIGRLDPNSPQFQAAQKACSNLLPAGPPASPAEQSAVQARAVKFARCMRSHGVPSFPDPGTGPHGGYFVQAESGPLSPGNPQFVRAREACRKATGGIY
ncbi:MAG: hypothetical protein ACRDZX_06250 [Acidimicrobiales bacterium]